MATQVLPRRNGSSSSSSSSSTSSPREDGWIQVPFKKPQRAMPSPTVPAVPAVPEPAAIPLREWRPVSQTQQPPQRAQRQPLSDQEAPRPGGIRGGFTGGGARGAPVYRLPRDPRRLVTKVCVICTETKELGRGRNSAFLASTPCAFPGTMGPSTETGHIDFCKQCLASLVSVAVRDAFTKVQIRCPHPECTNSLPDATIRMLLRYEVLDEGKLLQKFSKLQGSAHSDRLKELFSAKHLAEASPEEKQTIEWFKSNVRYCPRCNVLIEKNEGCNDLACVCGAHFCFGCGLDHINCKCHTQLAIGEENGTVATPQRHMQSKMSDVPKCFFCHEEGHKVADCPVRKRRDESRASRGRGRGRGRGGF